MADLPAAFFEGWKGPLTEITQKTATRTDGWTDGRGANKALIVRLIIVPEHVFFSIICVT